MKAMILAAGLGTRLRPLTDNRPKALVEISGRTLLEITLSRLRAFGVREVIINVHHFADMIAGYLKAKNNFGMRIEISREDILLDTGGGLKKAAWFFLEESSRLDEPFILHNVDVISTIDLPRMLQFHKEHHALATLAVQHRETSRYLLFNDQLQLCGRRSSGTAIPGCAPQASAELVPPASSPVIPNAATSARRGVRVPSPIGREPLSPQQGTAELVPSAVEGAVPKNVKKSGALAPEVPPQSLAFSGIHIISPRLLPMITEEGIFSIINTYLRLASQGEKILAFRADEYYWRDLGRPSDLAQAALDLQQKVSWGSEL
jgi:NDP-sugar pyrophosphorylase family protein